MPAQNRLKSVTVFSSQKAEVVRVVSLSVEKGQNKIDICGLSGSIDTESARVTGLGDVKVFDVVCSIGHHSQDFSSESTSEVIRALKAKKASLVSQKAASTSASWILANYASTLKADHISPEQADAFYDTFLTRANTAIQKDVELDEEILQLDRKIDNLDKAGSEKKGKADGKVSVVLMASEPAEVELHLTYLVRDVSWSAVYELYASTGAGKPARSNTLHYRARISQSTGEDWNGVQITLSTSAMDLTAQHVPAMLPTHIRPVKKLFGGGSFGQSKPTTGGLFGAPPVSMPVPPTTGLFGGVAGPGFGAPPQPTGGLFGNAASGTQPSSSHDDTQDFVDVPSAQEILPAFTEPKAIVSETPLFVSYRIEGETTIPSDGMTHKVAVAELALESDVVHIIVPRARAAVFLQAKVKNTSDYRLLPGPVDIYLDNVYVSKTSIKDIAPGDTFDCAFGMDQSVRATYTRRSKQVLGPKSQFQEQHRLRTYTSRTVLRNCNTTAAREIILRDALPLLDDENSRIQVILRQPEELGQIEQGDECKIKVDGQVRTIRWSKVVDFKGGKKDGMFEWVLNVEAGKEIVVETVWEVKAPVDVDWSESYHA
ncbi:hypothetical protein EVG20_g6412 [Dentipellis fragilis]|uniref:DUF4139 domain-containing protein n=1 Tax=Dentipellis fragilis TaxID=205917 RepID=A0A4Y9YMP8_9AGAM|nr:hypothetical protein EVG20_g6412 [Dentipellis fragilis]